MTRWWRAEAPVLDPEEQSRRAEERFEAHRARSHCAPRRRFGWAFLLGVLVVLLGVLVVVGVVVWTAAALYVALKTASAPVVVSLAVLVGLSVAYGALRGLSR